ncbi:MAG: hypothetical protein ACTSRA_21920 [Promethearchaeota archaeon]
MNVYTANHNRTGKLIFRHLLKIPVSELMVFNFIFLMSSNYREQGSLKLFFES